VLLVVRGCVGKGGGGGEMGVWGEGGVWGGEERWGGAVGSKEVRGGEEEMKGGGKGGEQGKERPFVTTLQCVQL